MKIIGALAALGLAGLVSAAEFEGIAPLGESGVEVARAAAIQDALENASLTAGARVSAASRSVNGALLAEAQTVRGSAVGEHKVLREWQTGLFYHVILDVQPPKPAPVVNKKAAPSAVSQCGGANYRRKILATHIWVLNPSQIPDMTRFPQELQSELARRMQAGGTFLPQVTLQEAAFEVRNGNQEPLFQPEQVRTLARRYGVQFVLGAILRDAAFEGEAYLPTIGEKVRPGERKSLLSIPFLEFTGFGMKATPAFRRFEMDFFVFDGVSGALINRHRQSGIAQGEVAQQPDAVGTARFFETDYGQLVDQQLNAAIQSVADDVRCIPFSARVVRVEGNRVFLDVGGTSRVAPGDRLQAYRLRPGQLVDNINGMEAARLGMAEEVAGTLQISDVQPLFSVAQLEGGRRLEEGDYVRFVGRESSR